MPPTNQQVPTGPPMSGPNQGPTPMRGVQGPRPTASPQVTMGGSGGMPEASSQEVITSLNNLFNVYTQVEPNQKARQETESKYNLLRDRLQEVSVLSPHLVSLLKHMTAAAEQNNIPSALSLHKELIQNHWQESKDWANALKILISFKSRFQQ